MHGNKPTIDELALKHLNRHPNDKSLSTYSKMIRRFGQKQTITAIESMVETTKMLGGEIGYYSGKSASRVLAKYFNHLDGQQIPNDYYAKYAYIKNT